MTARFVLRFFDDYGVGWLWAGNDAAFRAFDAGPLDEVLQGRFACFSAATLAEADRLATAHHGILDWDDPARPLPLDPAFCAAFDADVTRLHAAMQAELGPDFLVLDQQQRLSVGPG